MVRDANLSRMAECWRVHVVFVGRLAASVLLVTALALAAPDNGAPASAAEVQRSEPARPAVEVGDPADLIVWNRHVATLRARIGQVTPDMRVERIGERIADLPVAALAGEVRPVPSNVGNLSGYWITLDEQTLFALLPEDVDTDAGLTLPQTARAVADNLAAAFRARLAQQRLPLMLKAAALSLIATVLFAVGVWTLAWLRRWALKKTTIIVPAAASVRVRGVDLRPYLRAVEVGAVKALAVGLGLFACYVWLTFVLLQFPYTQPWGEGLGGWFIALFRSLIVGAVGTLPGFFTVLVIFLFTRLVTRMVDRFFRSVEGGWLRVDWLEAETARVTRRLVIALIWIFALTVAYPYIPGSGSEAFKGISVLLGLMISLGATGFVNQIMSGLVIVYARSLKTGEYVQVGENEGQITEIGGLATKMLTPTRQEITIPNATLVASSITNYSRMANADIGAIITTRVTIGYDTPWRQVQAMLLLAAERTATIRKRPKPEVRQRALSDFYVEYDLLFSIDRPERQRVILSELHAHIQDVFNEFGVQIMSPNFVSQPANKVWVPPQAWYQAPAEAPADRPTSLPQAADAVATSLPGQPASKPT
jgi:small-conductance mechanosensitive channel